MTFEIIGNINKIVIDYKKEDIILIGARRKKDLTLLNQDELDVLSKLLGFPRPRTFVKEYKNINEFLTIFEKKRKELGIDIKELIEGLVLYFDNGLICKLKTKEYLLLHKRKSNFTPEKIVNKISKKGLDNIFNQYPEEFKPVLEKYISYGKKYIKTTPFQKEVDSIISKEIKNIKEYFINNITNILLERNVKEKLENNIIKINIDTKVLKEILKEKKKEYFISKMFSDDTKQKIFLHIINYVITNLSNGSLQFKLKIRNIDNIEKEIKNFLHKELSSLLNNQYIKETINKLSLQTNTDNLKNILSSKLIILSGISGSGKSTIANEIKLANKHKNVIYLSLDEIRKQEFNLGNDYNSYYNLPGDKIKENENKVMNIFNNKLKNIREQFLSDPKETIIIIDNTNINDKSRLNILNIIDFIPAENIIVNILPQFSLQNTEERKKENKILNFESIKNQFGKFIKSYDGKDKDLYIDIEERYTITEEQTQYINNITFLIVDLIKNKESKDVDKYINVLLENLYEYKYLNDNETLNKNHISSYHQETLKEHIYNVIKETIKGTKDNNLIIASIFHDLGKIYTHKQIKKKEGLVNIFQGHETISYYIWQMFIENFMEIENQLGITTDLIGKIIKHHGDFNGVKTIEDIKEIKNKYNLTDKEIKYIYQFEIYDKRGAKPIKEKKEAMKKTEELLKNYLKLFKLPQNASNYFLHGIRYMKNEK